MIKVKLKEILKKKGMTLKELHEITGISMNSLSIFQNQKRDGIQFSTLERIASALDVSLSDLLQIVEDEYEIKVRINSYSTNVDTLVQQDLSASINFENIQSNYVINIYFDTKIIPNSPLNFLIVNINDIKFENVSQNIKKILTAETSQLYQKELLHVLSYLLIQELMKRFPYDRLTILDDILVKWSAIFPKFNLDSSNSVSGKITFNPRDYLVYLVPLDPNLILETKDYIPDTVYTAYIDSLTNLNIVTDINIEKESFQRIVSITIN